MDSDRNDDCRSDSGHSSDHRRISGRGLENEQNTNTNSWPDSGPDYNHRSDATGSSDRTNDEVKDESKRNRLFDRSSSGSLVLSDVASLENLRKCPSEIAPSARLSAPANLASFDTGTHGLPHVQNEEKTSRKFREYLETATCAELPEVEQKPNRLTGRELTEWAIKNYAVDPIQNSKNRWRIRLRCRKTGCKHEDHLGLKTVSFMSDSAFKKLTRSERKYELWKKAILAENAGTLRQGN